MSNYWQETRSQPTGIILLTGRFLGFCPAPIKVKFGSEEHCSLPNFTLIGSGVWAYCPQNFEFYLKILNFTNIIAPKGQVPCTILTKFVGFMRVLGLHNFAKFSCFSLINDKIIINLSAKLTMTSSG